MFEKSVPTELVFLDIETTGLDPFYHEVIEVGMIIADLDGTESSRIAFSMPFNQFRADAKALEVNGYGVREFAPFMEQDEGAKEVARATDGRIVVGNNVQFDLIFLRFHLKRHGLEPMWHYAPIELKSLIAGVMNLAPPWSTSMLTDRLGVPMPKDRHSALVDAQWNRDAYAALKLQGDYQP